MAEDPPSEKQVALLKKLGCEDIPASKKDAGNKIKELLDKKNGSNNSEQKTSPRGGTTFGSSRTVKYPIIDILDSNDEELLQGFDKIMAMAVIKTKEYNPDLNEGDNVFGQITSANADRMVQLLKIKAIREITPKKKE